MNTLRQFARFALICIFCAYVSQGAGAALVVPGERDGRVLEALLLHLLTDTNFDMTRVSTDNGATIVLHVRTLEKTGYLMPYQIKSDIGSHTLPSDVEHDLRRRNTSSDAGPDTYDSVTAFYTNVTFAAGIVVADLTETWKHGRRFGAFEDAYPKARGWLESYLPGYSKDGTVAVVRAAVGPWGHAAMLTALLEKRGDTWVVKWYHIARFA